MLRDAAMMSLVQTKMKEWPPATALANKQWSLLLLVNPFLSSKFAISLYQLLADC